MPLKEFKKEFYESRLDEWKNKYLKFEEMLHLIKLIRKDIKKNGGDINGNDLRVSIMSDIPNDKLDRRSFNLEVLNDTEGILNKNEKIFNSPIMYEIDKTYPEINSLQFEDDIKIFLYFLQIEVHNFYVFYLSIEKEIYTRTNSYLYERSIISSEVDEEEDQVSNQLKELIEIAYLTYSFYLYIDLNIEAVKYILENFDEYFININNGISIKKLYFSKNMLNRESDLKYILGFKIINECSILLENYCLETQSNYPKNKKIIEQCKELQDVLSFIIEKNTNRIDDNLFEIYQKDGKQNNIFKIKENLDFNIQSSFMIDDSQNELLEEEFEYDKQIKISITTQNKINLIFIYIHIFFYSFFGIIPYVLFFFLCIQKESDKKSETKNVSYFDVSLALTSTHLGYLFSKYIISNLETYKFPLVFFGICFCVSFSLTLMSFIFVSDEFDIENLIADEYILFSIFNILSRFIYGLSGGRIITRKYINLFLPESQVRFYSILYMILVNLGYIFGVGFLFIFIYIKLEFNLFYIKINKISFPFLIGFCLSFIYLILIIIFFTEPNGEKGLMLNHNIKANNKEKNIYSVNTQKKEELKVLNKEENKSKNNKNKQKEEKDKIDEKYMNKITSLISGQKLIYLDNDDESEEEDYQSNSARSYEGKKNNKIILYNETKTIQPNRKVSKKNKSNKIKNANGSINALNINDNKRHLSIASETLNEKLLSAEEIKGLNSIEKAIISLNNENNYNDTNLFPKELNKIKHNQLKNSNNTFFRTILVFVLLLNISNMYNEFILLLIQIYHNVFLSDQDIKKTLYSLLIILIISFLFSTGFTIISKKNIERKYLIILNIFLLLNISAILFFLITGIDFGKWFCLIDILLIFITNNIIIGITSIFSERIVPPFVKFCCFNVKYLISYISTIGKLLGAISFSVMIFFYEKNIEKESKNKYFNIFAGMFNFLTLVCLIILIINYNSLKMRAISKIKSLQI